MLDLAAIRIPSRMPHHKAMSKNVEDILIRTINEADGAVSVVVEAADKNNISMVFTGIRHFKH